jgi:hypothetical protein
MGPGPFARRADALVIPSYARYLPWGGGLSTTISTFPAFLKLIAKAMN